MTFEEAEELLNKAEVEKVAAQMRQWHPVVLAQMLEAVGHTENLRYPGSHHPNWTDAVHRIAEKAGFIVVEARQDT